MATRKSTTYVEPEKGVSPEHMDALDIVSVNDKGWCEHAYRLPEGYLLICQEKVHKLHPDPYDAHSTEHWHRATFQRKHYEWAEQEEIREVSEGTSYGREAHVGGLNHRSLGEMIEVQVGPTLHRGVLTKVKHELALPPGQDHRIPIFGNVPVVKVERAQERVTTLVIEANLVPVKVKVPSRTSYKKFNVPELGARRAR